MALFENKNLFKTLDSEGKHSDLIHLGHIIAYLGGPPRRFIEKGGRCARYFEEDGAALGHRIRARAVHSDMIRD
jgi:hypothetical protein